MPCELQSAPLYTTTGRGHKAPESGAWLGGHPWPVSIARVLIYND